MIKLDYSFLDNEEATKANWGDAVKVAAAIDDSSRAEMATQVDQKGESAYAAAYISDWLERIGHKRVILQSDN